MPQNVRTTTGGTARALEYVCSAADTFQIPSPGFKIYTRRLQLRFGLTPSVAALVAELCMIGGAQ